MWAYQHKKGLTAPVSVSSFPLHTHTHTHTHTLVSYVLLALVSFQVRKGVLAGGMFPAASLESGERLQFNFGVTPFAHPPPSPFMAVSKAFGVGGVDAAVAEAEDKAALATEQSVDITSAEAAATPAPAAAQPTTTTAENSAAVQADAAPEAKEKPSPATAAAAAAAPAQDKPAFAALDLSIIKRAEDLLRTCVCEPRTLTNRTPPIQNLLHQPNPHHPTEV